MSRLRELAEEERNMELAAEAAWKMAGGECEGAQEGEEQWQEEEEQEQEQEQEQEEEEEQDYLNVIIFLYLIAAARVFPVYVSNRGHFSTCGLEITC
jgi:hypothetical protein